MSKTKQRASELDFTLQYDQRKQEIEALKDLIAELVPLMEAGRPDCTRKARFTKEDIGMWQLPNRSEIYSTHVLRRFIDQDGSLRWEPEQAKSKWIPLSIDYELTWTHPADLKNWRKDLQALKQRLLS